MPLFIKAHLPKLYFGHNLNLKVNSGHVLCSNQRLHPLANKQRENVVDLKSQLMITMGIQANVRSKCVNRNIINKTEFILLLFVVVVVASYPYKRDIGIIVCFAFTIAVKSKPVTVHENTIGLQFSINNYSML